MDTQASVTLRLIMADVKDTETGVLRANLTTIWNSFADKFYTAPRLQELYTRRAAIDLVMADLRLSANTTLGSDLSQDQKDWITNLQLMRANVLADIALIEQKARANRTPQLGRLRPAATPATDGLTDPNDPYYRGDPTALWKDRQTPETPAQVTVP